MKNSLIQRAYDLSDGTSAKVIISCPYINKEFEDDFCCDFEIHYDSNVSRSRIFGVDGFQAVLLAMKMSTNRLKNFAQQKDIGIRWSAGEYDGDFGLELFSIE